MIWLRRLSGEGDRELTRRARSVALLNTIHCPNRVGNKRDTSEKRNANRYCHLPAARGTTRHSSKRRICSVTDHVKRDCGQPFCWCHTDAEPCAWKTVDARQTRMKIVAIATYLFARRRKGRKGGAMAKICFSSSKSSPKFEHSSDEYQFLKQNKPCLERVRDGGRPGFFSA